MATTTATSQVELEAAPRRDTGSGPAGRVRREGRTPAVVYGHEVDATPVSLDALSLYHALHTEAGLNVLIRLQLDGDEHLTVAREVQHHPVKDHILHVDLVAVDPDREISVDVPVRLTDEASARESGGVVNLVMHTVPLRVKPLEVPTDVELSVAGMDIGDTRRVSDIDLPEAAELDTDPDRTVVTINAPDVLEEPEEEPEGLEALEGLTEEELEALGEMAPEPGVEPEVEEGLTAAAAGPGAAVPESDEEDEEPEGDEEFSIN